MDVVELNKKEIIGIIGIVIISLVAIFIMKGTSLSADAEYVVITIDNKVYKKIPFDHNTYESFDIHTDLGSNHVVIEKGAVKVIDSDCPDQVCVNTKAATHVGDMIVCLPHKLIIEITDK